MNDSQKLEKVKAQFQAKLDSILTLAEFKTMINSITPLKIKNFIKAGLQTEADQRRNVFSPKEIQQADDLEDLKTEI